MKSQVAELNTANDQLSSENKSFHAQLSGAQTEIKTLTAKLAATRASSTNADSKVPGSAIKAQRTMMPGSTEAAKDPQIRQLKEDLYSDLTGLIIRGVKRGEDEDIYDCIQTGRNGSKFLVIGLKWNGEGSLTSKQRSTSISPSQQTKSRRVRATKRLSLRTRRFLTKAEIATFLTSCLTTSLKKFASRAAAQRNFTPRLWIA